MCCPDGQTIGPDQTKHCKPPPPPLASGCQGVETVNKSWTPPYTYLLTGRHTSVPCLVCCHLPSNRLETYNVVKLLETYNLITTNHLTFLALPFSLSPFPSTQQRRSRDFLQVLLPSLRHLFQHGLCLPRDVASLLCSVLHSALLDPEQGGESSRRRDDAEIDGSLRKGSVQELGRILAPGPRGL